MLTRTELAGLLSVSAEQEATRQGFDAYATRDLAAEGETVLTTLFRGLARRCDGPDVPGSTREEVNSWAHREPNQFEDDWRQLLIDRQQLLHVAEQYLDRPWLACRQMDWLLVDVLVYAEYQATLDHCAPRLNDSWLAHVLGGTE